MGEFTCRVAMLELAAGDIATPQDAAAAVLQQVRADAPYVITHGSSRHRFEPRVARLLRAYDAMEQRRSIEG
jgi:hypothetical protein